jgi:hypothetical protein
MSRGSDASTLHVPAVETPEVLFVRTSKRRIAQRDTSSFEAWSYHVGVDERSYRVAPVFIRSISKLRQHLELSIGEQERPLDPGASRFAIYSIRAGLSVSIDPLEISLIELSGWDEIAMFLAETQVRGPVIVWTSDVGIGSPEMKRISANAPLWFVCDTSPLRMIEPMQRFMHEVRGVSCSSRVPGSALKALAFFQLGESGAIDGVLFPGTVTMSDPVVPIISRIYGDNLRDFNSMGLTVHYESKVRENIAQLITDLISITERWFSMSDNVRSYES